MSARRAHLLCLLLPHARRAAARLSLRRGIGYYITASLAARRLAPH